ncbi:MAG: carboxypeptidase regulatory-like domain-containing protein [Acidobacteriota bacterium]
MPLQRSSLGFTLAIATVLLIAATSGHAQKPDAKPQPAGTISGQVSLRGKPIAGISVAAIAGDTVNRRDTAARTVTDGQGYYGLTGLPPGQYQIWTLTPGLIAESQPYPGYLPFGSTKSILLAANEDVGNVDLKLTNGGVITGRISTVDTKPVVDEQVLLELLDENGNPRFGVPRSFRDEVYRTDDRGVYRIYGLPAGRYKVSVGFDPKEGIRSSSYPRTYYSDPSDAAKAAILELKEGGEAELINIKVGERTASFAVAGHIMDATTGRPVAGIRYRIAVVEKDSGRTPSFSGLPTESNGEFRFEGLRPGRYNIAAMSDYNNGGDFYGDPVDFEIVDQDVTGLEIKAIRGFTLSGAVIAEGLSTRELLALLPDLRVHAWPETPTPIQATGSGNAVVAADGNFQMPGLRPGRLSVDVSANVRNATRPTVARIEREGVDLGRTLEMQQSVSGIVIVVSYGTGSIRGTMSFAGGTPPADARIFVTFRREGSPEAMGVQADARGNFIIKNLSPGTYELEPRLTLPDRRPTPPRQTQKQIVNVTNGSESEVSFLIDLSQPQVRP